MIDIKCALSGLAFVLWLVVLGVRIYDHNGFDLITDAGLIAILLLGNFLRELNAETD